MVNLNVVYAYTILSVFLYNTYGLNVSNEGLFNVGTVLFTSSDLYKKRWDRTNTELLQCRKYFQNIIPSPNIDTLSEDYINYLLKYFTNAFSVAKREATDPGIADIMEKALTDTIAGFFKAWMLPITKFAFYGGTVSEENAIKVFKYYETLKTNLNTNGSGWRSPDKRVLNSVGIKVVPFVHVSNTRSMRDPCDHLAYYEKYNNDLTIATPYINWDGTASSMFLPLRNESLVLLNSPSSSKAVLKYYDIAENCCSSKNREGCNDFDLRFQDWLSTDVVPHLNDDNLYVAFGGVLGLLNKTKGIYESISDACIYDCEKCEQKPLLAGLPPCMSSKRFLILIVVLFLEIIWCVPTLLYLLFCRKRPYIGKSSYFFHIFNRKRSNRFTHTLQTVERVDRSDERKKFINRTGPKSFGNVWNPLIKENGVKIYKKAKSRNIEIDTQYPSHTSKRSTGQVTESISDTGNKNESVTFISEIPLKTSLKKKNVTSSHVQAVNNLSNNIYINKDINKATQSEDFAVKKINTTITKVIRQKSGSNSKTCIKNINSSNNTNCSEKKNKIGELDNKNETNDACACSCCIDAVKKFETSLKKVENTEARENKPESRKTHVDANLDIPTEDKKTLNTSRKTKQPNMKTKDSTHKDSKKNRMKGLKLNSGEPLLEIRIDKPAAEITVDVTKYSGDFKKNTKPSKIPRRAPEGYIKEESKTSTNQIVVKKRSADDITIKGKQRVRRTNMNLTL